MSEDAPDSKARFSDRVQDYIKYRPGYPSELFAFLKAELGIPAGSIFADMGSGTGIFTRGLLEAGYRVEAVEPNAEMRAAAERDLAGFAGFRSIAAPAEKTGLPDHSIDAVAAAQAFHWFDPVRARAEWQRILRRPDLPVILVWNEREEDTTPFLREYEEILVRYGTDYLQVRHRSKRGPEDMAHFFAPRGYSVREWPTEQRFDLEGLFGRAFSSSYVPKKGQPGHEAILNALRECFARHQVGGQVEFRYMTRAYF